MTALTLFGLMLGVFLLNAPIAVAIGVASVLCFWLFGDVSLMLVVQRMYGGADSFPLMAVPLFMLAGHLMDAGGLSRRLVALAQSMVGWLPGGLAAVATVSAMFFAGISGSAAADTAAVGGILIPAMVRAGYPKPLAAAVQASGGSIGVIIPPSIPMIIFGVLTGASIGKLFLAGIIPGLLMGASLIGMNVLLCRKHDAGSASFSLSALLRATRKGVFALGAPVIILGGIMGGVFTATESAAVAVGYAFVVGLFVHRELRLAEVPRLCLEAGVTASVVMFIIAQATAFSWFMTIQEMPQGIAEFLLGISSNPVVLLLLLNLLLLLAGAVVETTAALLLFVPVLLPIAPELGIDVIQLGAIMVVNLAIGMLTPPLGICLIVAAGISGSRLEATAKSVLPFLLILIVDLLLISFWAPLTTWLPHFLG